MRIEGYTITHPERDPDPVTAVIDFNHWQTPVTLREGDTFVFSFVTEDGDTIELGGTVVSMR